jgi:cell division protein FtsQ
MWDKPQALRQLANTLLGISLLLALFGTVHYTVHLPVFALNAVQLTAVPQRVDAAQVDQIVRNELSGNFFTVDLEGARKSFEKLPWVRKVNVRRHFPWQLEVELEEHVALAHWNGTELVNTHGEVFAAECDRVTPEAAPRSDEVRVSGGGVNSAQPKVGGGLPAFDVFLAGASGTHRPPPCGETAQVLPKFIGQPDTAAEVAQMYKTFGDQLAPLKQEVAQISLSPRRAWQLRLNSGMVLELGREQAQERLARFVAVYPYSLASMQHTVNYVDLRYSNGFAAYLPGGVIRGQQG